MRVTRALPSAAIGLLATAAALTVGVAPASAAPAGGPVPEIGSLAASAVVDKSGDTATVVGQYRCWGPSDQMHLWVSVKQGGPDPTAEGSSSTVDAWYDTNVSQDVAVTCDGSWHVTRVTLGRHATDFTGRPLEALHRGAAWLQFCLVPMQQGEEFLFASKSRWLNVSGAGA